MLTGQYTHSIDAKGRVNFPREAARGAGRAFYHHARARQLPLRLLGGQVGPARGKAARAAHQQIRPPQPVLLRGSRRGGAGASRGRVLLPAHLREYAGLDRDVTIAGVSNRAEIWDSERWEKQNEQLTAQSIATAMDELGF